MAKVNKGLRDTPKSRIPNDAYLNNYDNIFKKKDKKDGVQKESR